jgi:hypothetical protein
MYYRTETASSGKQYCITGPAHKENTNVIYTGHYNAPLFHFFLKPDILFIGENEYLLITVLTK